jgi:cellulose synthase/poly-beta-1,6-N-acetylglucosamine synthase-like glycosyltransferase
LQSIEYITGLNLDRRAQSFLNCITTLPGAASAYKRSALTKVGYFSNDTMAEDTDLTLGLLVNGYKLVFEDKALVYTEAPISIKDLYKQRFRWLHGNISCIWKYRQFLFKTTNKTFLWFGFPNFIFNNFLIFLFIPFMFLYNVDLFYNFSLWKLEMLLAFILLDISMSIFAYLIDNGTKGELFYAIIQRLFYLFFFQFIFFSVILAFMGKRKTSWNKVTRSGKWFKKG